MSIRFYLPDCAVKVIINNYLRRVVDIEDSRPYDPEYETEFPLYQDLPTDLKEWLTANKITANLVYTPQEEFVIEFYSTEDAAFYNLTWINSE